MKTYIITLLLVATGAFAQMPPADLAQVKIAAEAGDAAAEAKLAESYSYHNDPAQTVIWYRKSAMQGYLPAQAALGETLLWRWRMGITLKPEARYVIGAEALKWISLAAGQGNKQSQANLAQLFLEGNLVQQDYVQAYKWGELAAQGSPYNMPSVSGKSTRDAAILKMNTAQIEEARRQVAAFSPQSPKPAAIVEPAWVQEIKLVSIGGPPEARLAIINNRTFGPGDVINLKLGGQPVAVRCVEIRDVSVVVAIAGIEGTRELKLNP